VNGVEIEHAFGDVFQEPAVVADDEESARLRLQHALEPEDSVDVEMVGRLVHQDQVGLAQGIVGHDEAFTISLALGISVIYAGFLVSVATARSPATPTTTAPAT
jgi:hypothetical protein